MSPKRTDEIARRREGGAVCGKENDDVQIHGWIKWKHIKKKITRETLLI